MRRAKARLLPDVEAASINDELPLKNGWEIIVPFKIDGQADPGPGRRPLLDWQMISPDYFRLLQIPLLDGHPFDDTDTTNTENVIIVDTLLAQKYFPGQDALGKRIKLEDKTCRIIGVAPHVEYMMPGEEESAPQAYLSYQQSCHLTKRLPSSAGLRWRNLVAEFTGGDPAIQRGLNAMYADQDNWPQPQKQSFGIRPEIHDFIRRAAEAS